MAAGSGDGYETKPSAASAMFAEVGAGYETTPRVAPFEEAIPNKIGFDEQKSLFVGILRILSFPSIRRAADVDE